MEKERKAFLNTVPAAMIMSEMDPPRPAYMLTGGAYVTIWSADEDPVAIDGIHAVPGVGLDPSERGRGAVPVELDYGGGMTTIVGPGSVAVPGSIAAFERASKRFGQVDWDVLFEPAINVTRDGYPLSASCRYYLGYCSDLIYDRSEVSVYRGESQRCTAVRWQEESQRRTESRFRH